MALDPGSIVCRFAAAGEMVCSQVQAQVGPIAAFLDKWQSLLGAFLGAIIGIVGALIVARSATLRSRKIAAHLLLPDLKRYMAAGERVEDDLVNLQLHFISDLKVVPIKTHRPKSVHLHASEINDVLDLDSRLWAHLMRCQQLERDLGVALEKYDKTKEQVSEANGEQARAMASPQVEDLQQSMAIREALEYRLVARSALVEQTWDHCVEHARPVPGGWASTVPRTNQASYRPAHAQPSSGHCGGSSPSLRAARANPRTG